MTSSPPKEKGTGLLWFFIAFIAGILLWFKGEQWLHSLLIYLSHAHWARDLVSQNPLAWQVASRFVAGETIDDAMQATQALNTQGMSVTIDYLGERVDDAALAVAARDEIARLLDAIAEHQVNANVSLKLTQLGIAIDEKLAYENLRYLLQCARTHHNKIRVDMEDTPWIDATLRIYRQLRDREGFDNVGVVIQSYLYRSQADIDQLVIEGAWVRLVKGAYLEPPHLAYPKKADVDASYIQLMQHLLGEDARHHGVYAGIATHDENMIQATIQYAQTNNIDPSLYEFQMLYGIRRDRQASLINEGYQMRIYVPYGKAWYPYFVRRLAERPANLWFFLNNLLEI